MKILNTFYNFFGDSDILNYISRKGINISWVVEAGCHDGEDTLRICRQLRPIRMIAFEPDEHARFRAIKCYAANNLDVELYSFGLSDKNSNLYLNFLNGVEGTGSTFLAETGSSSVEVRRLNDLKLNLSYGGMLWLDVEGHAVQALNGASDYLGKLAVAKVEIQMHKMSDTRISDYWEVNKIMLAHGLIPVRGPVYPGFFGDVIYLNKKETNILDRLWSSILTLHMTALHRMVYPIIGKPRSSSLCD